MKDDAARWRKLDDAEIRLQKQKSIGELYNDGYRLYCQCHYRQAAMIFAQASLAAKQEGNLPEQCKNLNWEGYCYYKDKRLKKALACFLQTEQIGSADAIYQFYNLENLFNVAMCLHMPQAKIRSILDELISYKGSQQIGGSKSMTLKAEYTFFSSCGKHAEALAKAQEAFSSQIKKAPYYNENVYFANLVTAYRLNEQLPDAWTTLYRWRKEGNSKHADTKRKQLMQELKLNCHENKFDAAWDVLQQIKAEEQYLGRAGMYIDTLEQEILIGAKTDHLEQIKPALNVIFKKYRNSEDLEDRYMCYKAFAFYCCVSCSIASQTKRDRMEHHAEFWLTKAEQMAKHLDELMQVIWRTKEIQRIRKDFEKV